MPTFPGVKYLMLLLPMLCIGNNSKMDIGLWEIPILKVFPPLSPADLSEASEFLESEHPARSAAHSPIKSIFPMVFFVLNFILFPSLSFCERSEKGPCIQKSPYKPKPVGAKYSRYHPSWLCTNHLSRSNNLLAINAGTRVCLLYRSTACSAVYIIFYLAAVLHHPPALCKPL